MKPVPKGPLVLLGAVGAGGLFLAVRSALEGDGFTALAEGIAVGACFTWVGASVWIWRLIQARYDAVQEVLDAWKKSTKDFEERLLDSKHWPHIVEGIYDPMCPRCKPRVGA